MRSQAVDIRCDENIVFSILVLIFCEIWDTTECGPAWDLNSQPFDFWANH